MSFVPKAVLVIAALLSFLFLMIYGLGNALWPLLISFGLAYLVFPIVQKMETKGIRRHRAVLAVFALIFAGLTLALVLILPPLIEDANAFIRVLPQITARAIERMEAVSRKFGYELALSPDEIKATLLSHSSNISENLLKSVTRGFFSTVSGLTHWVTSILGFFLIPLFFFYVINDYEKILTEMKSYVPPAFRPKVTRYLILCDRVLSGYIRGQLMVALVLGVLYAMGLSLVGLRFGILIGLLTGLLSVIPYAGFSIGFVSALIVGLANQEGFVVLVGVVVVFLVVQVLEGTFITPKLVGDKVGLHPLAIMLALIVGGNVGGLIGMLVAIPIAAIVKVVLQELKQEYFQLEIYRQ